MNIVVTGASRGIGKAIARRFVKEGWNAAVCSLHPEKIEAAAKELRSMNPASSILARAVDLSNKEELKRFAQEVQQEFGKIDILVNNAGIFVPGAIFEEEEGVLEETLAINLMSAYHLTRAFLPQMQKEKEGHIFNMCSTASLKSYPNGGSYSISKHALLGFSRNLREEMKPFRIKVTAICPGPTLTDSWSGFKGPEDRMMPPQDIAEIVWSAYHLAKQTVIEDIVLRPIDGDIS